MYQYKREPLTVAEEAALRAAARTPPEIFSVTLFLETGMRVSELARLHPDQIDWQRRLVTLYGKSGKKGKHLTKRRVVPLSDEAFDALTRYQWLLTNFDRVRRRAWTTPRTIHRMVKRCANRARISKKVSPHVLRHTFACACLREGIHPMYLMRLLGHERMTTTQAYLNLSPEDVIADFRRKWKKGGMLGYGPMQNRSTWTG